MDMRRGGWVQSRSSNLKNLSGTGVFAGSQHNCDKALSVTVPATLAGTVRRQGNKTILLQLKDKRVRTGQESWNSLIISLLAGNGTVRPVQV